MKIIITTFLFSILFITTSCDETQKVFNTASNVQLNGNYNINEVMGENYSSKKLVINFDAMNNSFNATTECNGLFGTYSIDLYVIKFGDIASTKKLCEGQMDAERDMTEAFNNTGSYTLENGVLKLMSANDRSVLLTATKVIDTNDN